LLTRTPQGALAERCGTMIKAQTVPTEAGERSKSLARMNKTQERGKGDQEAFGSTRCRAGRAEF